METTKKVYPPYAKVAIKTFNSIQDSHALKLANDLPPTEDAQRLQLRIQALELTLIEYRNVIVALVKQAGGAIAIPIQDLEGRDSTAYVVVSYEDKQMVFTFREE